MKCNPWVLKETIKNKLMVFERKVQEKSLVLQKKEMVHGESNNELDKLIRHKNIINYTKTQRLSSFGHLH